MKWRFVFFLLIALCSAFFLENLENLLLAINASWTLAKILAYVLLLLFCLLSAVYLYNLLKPWSKSLRLLMASLLLCGFFAFGFYRHPIYQGDFDNTYQTESVEMQRLDSANLLVLTIPDCPYCKESIMRMNRLQQRNPDIKITYLVLSREESKLTYYSERLNPKIHLKLIEATPEFMKLSAGKFPSFLVQHKTQTRVYHNNGLGTRALDFIESAY